VGVLTKNILEKLALMGCNPGVPLALKWIIRDPWQPTQDHVLGDFQPSPFDKLRAGSAGLHIGIC